MNLDDLNAEIDQERFVPIVEDDEGGFHLVEEYYEPFDWYEEAKGG